MTALGSPASELIALLRLSPHPEGGFYRETFRSAAQVQASDQRSARSALTTIDFLLLRSQCSAWHRVASDEVWHLLEGGPLRLWLMPPALDRIDHVDLKPVGPGCAPRHTVAAGWWQAAEPLGEFALVGATVGPGFEFEDFGFGRSATGFMEALQRLAPGEARLL